MPGASRPESTPVSLSHGVSRRRGARSVLPRFGCTHAQFNANEIGTREGTGHLPYDHGLVWLGERVRMRDSGSRQAVPLRYVDFRARRHYSITTRSIETLTIRPASIIWRPSRPNQRPINRLETDSPPSSGPRSANRRCASGPELPMECVDPGPSRSPLKMLVLMGYVVTETSEPPPEPSTRSTLPSHTPSRP